MTCRVDCEVQPLDWFDYSLGFVSVFLLDFDWEENVLVFNHNSFMK